ncbi:MAG: aspartate aminotransferase family protein [Gemmatimonadales bacterium]|nr:MAG: aspartate aminotransferase family protein [Gemmatimonadales bacterium]
MIHPSPAFGRELPRMLTPPPGPRSSALAARLAAVESRNVTFLGPDFPVFWTEARGANVRDADGNVYLDLTGAFGVSVAGHAHPAIVEAIRAQAGELIHGMGDVHPPALKVELLEALAELAPWRESLGVLASSGSEAVEIALKTALLATDRPGVIAFEGSYHGLTPGALATTAREDFRGPFRRHLHDGVQFVPFPDVLEGEDTSAGEALEAVRHAFREGEAAGRPVGAVIVEPIQGRGGVRVPPDDFLRELRNQAHSEGALLIFDEIFTGFGRTGQTFALEHEGVAPDLLCVGKALGGGLPLSACLGSREVMDAWPISRGEALHTSTFLGHPLSCASALAFLKVLEEEKLVERARETGARIRRGLEKALSDEPRVRGIRGRGLFLGIVLGGDAPLPGAGADVAAAALQAGLILLPAGDQGHVVELSPPLTLTGPQAEAAVDRVARAVRQGLDAWEA